MKTVSLSTQPVITSSTRSSTGQFLITDALSHNYLTLSFQGWPVSASVMFYIIVYTGKTGLLLSCAV